MTAKIRYHTFVFSERQVQKIAAALFECAMRDDEGEKPHDYTLSAMQKISDRNLKASRKRSKKLGRSKPKRRK